MRGSSRAAQRSQVSPPTLVSSLRLRLLVRRLSECSTRRRRPRRPRRWRVRPRRSRWWETEPAPPRPAPRWPRRRRGRRRRSSSSPSLDAAAY
uniref:Uncharacterized protein n=1 Tax=Zea mays TaxID=4577 RepID=C4J5V2_MAIZE|nr:unknown [Zea mays]